MHLETGWWGLEESTSQHWVELPMARGTMLDYYDVVRPGPRFWIAFGILCIAWALDTYDFFIIGFLLAALGHGWHLTYLQSSTILLSGGVGAIAGSLFFGAIADRAGRKPVLIAAAIICAIGSGGIALVPDGDWWVFSILRLIVGLGLGGIGTLLVVMAVEITPAPMRLTLLGWPILLPPVGTMLAATTTSALIAALGWRGVALLGLFPLLLCIPFAVLLPESPRWLVTVRKGAHARRVVAQLSGTALAGIPENIGAAGQQPNASLAELYQHPGRFWLIVVIWLSASTTTNGVYLWGPSITAMLLHVTPAAAAKDFVYIALAGLAGRVLFSILPAVIGRRRCGAIIGFGIAVTLGLAAILHDKFLFGIPLFVILLTAGAIFFDGGYCSLTPYSAEIFPTRLAARGFGLAQAANGLGKIQGPLCLSFFAGSGSVVSAHATEAAVLPAFLFLAGCGAVLGMCFVVFAPDSNGKPFAINSAVL